MNGGLLVGGASLGLVVTILTSIFKTINLSSRLRHTIAVAISVVASVLISWQHFNGDYSVPNLLQSFSAVYASSQLFYQYLLSGTNLDQILTAFAPLGKAGEAADVAVEVVAPVLDESGTTTPGA
jgi:hypothetical protein